MKSKIMWIVILILLLILLSISISLTNFSKKCNYISDCGKNQYCEADTFKCKNIVNECSEDSDCDRYETCESKVIATGWACLLSLDEECHAINQIYHNVCELTTETKKYCETDSDCIWALNIGCCGCPEIYNKDVAEEYNLVLYELGKDYSSLITVNCSDVVCSPCILPTNLTCVNNKCQKKEEFSYEPVLIKFIPHQCDEWAWSINQSIEALESYNITVLNYYKVSMDVNSVCEACNCGTGYVYYFLIYESDFNKVPEGFSELNNEDCPDFGIGCMPMIPSDYQAYCGGAYHEWIKENCNVSFTY